jgi:hypothetical protein
MPAYTHPAWKRELTITVAGLLGGRNSDLAAAAMIVETADGIFGMSRAVDGMPADKADDPSSIDLDASGQSMPNAFVDAVNAFWEASRKVVRGGGEEKVKEVRAALKERGRSAWLHVGKDVARQVLLLSADVLAQVKAEGWPAMWSGGGMSGINAGGDDDGDYTTPRYGVPCGG